nr:ABC transporter substrate-binding protein [Terrimesophilobacter mesophilus]
MSQPFFSLNDRTSFGNSPANSAVLQAVDSSFNRYDAASELVTDTSFGQYTLLSNDPLTVKFTIADGVTWSDGVPVDAADLLLAWVANSGARNSKGVSDSAYRDPETGRYSAPFPGDVVHFDGSLSEGLQYATTTPVIGEDGRSLTVTWDRYVVDWALTLQVGLPAHVVASRALGLPLAKDSDAGAGDAPDADRLRDARAAKGRLIDAIVDDDTAALSAIANTWNSDFDLDAMPDDPSLLLTNGPYLISAFTSGESMTLSANPRYHGVHAPAIETIDIRFLADPLDQVAALRDGTVDVIVPRAGPEVVTALAAIPGATVLTGIDGTFEHLDLRFAKGRHSTFEDPRVRQAFLMVVPVQEITDAAVGSDLAADAARSSLVFLPGAAGYDAAVAANGSADYSTPDVAGAKRLLEDAGVSKPAVCILFDPSNPKRIEEYDLIRDSAARAGFVVSNCSSPDWLNLLGTPGTYDASIFAWSSTNQSVAGLQSIFGTGGRGNFNGFSDPEVDSLLSQLSVTPDAARQRVIRVRLDSALYASAYGIPLYQDPAVVAHNASVSGIAIAPLAPGILWNVWEWAPVTAQNPTPATTSGE